MRTRIFQIMCLVLLCALRCDEPLTFDAEGVAHGTGERVYKYDSGEVQLREEYVDGELIRSRWFKRDGTLVQQTRWEDGTGEGIYLREDGSIRRRMHYVNGVAEGEATEYNEAGNITKVITYRGGQPVSETAPPATQPDD